MMKSNMVLIQLLISLIAFLLYFWYLNQMFENDRNYQYLTEVEREMSLTSEQALYYYYYKIFTEDPNQNLSEIFTKIFRDDRSQAPDVVNSFQQLTILPEIFLGLSYRWMRTLLIDYFKVDFDEDWQRCYFIEDVENEQNYDPKYSVMISNHKTDLISTCEGIGDPFYFYIYAVFALNSLVPVLIGFIAFIISNQSLCSMFLTMIMFAYNQTNSSRVQWAVSLRENFGYPLFLFHNLWLIKLFFKFEQENKLPNTRNLFCLTLLILGQLLCWQFSPFILLIQSIAIYLSVEFLPQLFQKGYTISNLPLESFVRRYFICNTIAVILQSLIQLGNLFVLHTPYFVLLSSYLSASLIWNKFYRSLKIAKHYYSLSKFCLVLILITWNVFIFKKFNYSEQSSQEESNDVHIWMLLASKFNSSAFGNFHTKLYTCAKEYDWISWSDFHSMICSRTYLGPLALLAFMLELRSHGGSIQKWMQKAKLSTYNWIISLSFFLMATLIMRLKLLMMPQVCIMACSVLKNKSSGCLEERTVKNKRSLSSSDPVRWLVCSIIVTIVSMKAFPQLRNQLQHQAQFTNKPLEQILTVVREQTPPDSIFGGSMSTMATVMLSTRRRIANNPFYESSLIRSRTYTIYQLYSEHPMNAIYKDLCRLHLNYIIIEPIYCYGRLGRCQMIDLWRQEDQRVNYWNDTNSDQKSRQSSRLCHQMLKNNKHVDHSSWKNYFELIAANDLYHLFRIINCT